MKRLLRVLIPIILSVAIIVGIGWYLFSYDKGFTQDMFLSFGRIFANNGNMTVASHFYDWAYRQNHDRNAVSVELAEKYIQAGNYTKAEASLNRAVKDGANAAVYTALCKAYVAQDKLYDAVELLNNVPDESVKKELDALRPQTPYSTMDNGPYTELVEYSIESPNNKLYVNPNGEYPSVDKHFYNQPITLSEGENKLYAVAVSDSGLVSKLQIFNPTVMGVIQTISFHDPYIEKEIRNMLNIPDNAIVYSNEVWDIKSFTVPEQARNYTDLQHLIHLESLTIENGAGGQLHKINNNLESFNTSLKELTVRSVPLSDEDLDFIAGLTAMEKLTLEDCSLTTVAMLSELKNLRYLNLNYNTIGNISPISSATELTHLYMQRNALTDLSALSACTKLEVLDVSFNSLSSITTVSAFINLKELNISDNNPNGTRISDISPLSNITTLTSFIASNNAISDITPLKNSLGLTHVEINRNKITDLSPLAGHQKIYHLDFSTNQVAVLPQWDAKSEFVTIIGSYNLISDLTPLGNLQYINNIIMDHNEEIASVECLAGCPTLIKVDVFGTKVSDVSMLKEQSIIVNYNPVEPEETEETE